MKYHQGSNVWLWVSRIYRFLQAKLHLKNLTKTCVSTTPTTYLCSTCSLRSFSTLLFILLRHLLSFYTQFLVWFYILCHVTVFWHTPYEIYTCTVLAPMWVHILYDFSIFCIQVYSTRLGQLGANISPDRSSLMPQVLIGNFLKHNYPLLYELQHINLLCLYLPKEDGVSPDAEYITQIIFSIFLQW